MAAAFSTRWSAYRALFGLLATALFSATPTASAQQAAFPTKSIRLIASSSPGGGVDTIARLVGNRLSEAFGQTVIVDNRAGANGALAGGITARAAPDGYTIMLGAVANLGVITFFYKQVGYDPLRDLAPVTPAISASSILAVNPAVPVKSVKELVALAKSQPGKLTYSSSGTGGAGHLAGALFQSLAKVEFLHVPFKGGAPGMVALLAGDINLSFGSMPTTVPHVKTGRLRALAVTTAQRSKILPDMPTIAEAGVPGYDSNSWYGFVVPAKTPPAIIDQLNAAIVKALNRPDAVEAVMKLGQEVWTTTPAAFGAHIKADYEKWGRVLREAGITPQ